MNSYCSLHDISDLWAGVTMLVIAGVVAWVTKRVIDATGKRPGHDGIKGPQPPYSPRGRTEGGRGGECIEGRERKGVGSKYA